MRISEIFYSIQGEGELTGVPTVFIRSSGCNLRCRWCDTPYASWNPEGEEMSIEDIIKDGEAIDVTSYGLPRWVEDKIRARGWEDITEVADKDAEHHAQGGDDQALGAEEALAEVGVGGALVEVGVEEVGAEDNEEVAEEEAAHAEG
jgi:hypothetical protein